MTFPNFAVAIYKRIC